MSLFHFLNHPAPAESLPPFVHSVRDRGNVRIVRLRGDVSTTIGAEVDRCEEKPMRDGSPFDRSLLFDFAETTDVDFSTVAYLVKAARERMAHHARMGIINAPQRLLAEIEIAKLGDVLTVFDSEAEALRQLSA